MTVCLFFQPGGVPTVVSDTLISREIVTGPSKTTLRADLSPRDLVLRELNGIEETRPVMSQMIRKVVVLKPGVIICLAGRLDQIVPYVREVRAFWDQASDEDKAFESVSSRFHGGHYSPYKCTRMWVVCRYNEDTKQDDVAVMGNGMFTAEIPGFGKCFAIGTGAKDVLKFLEHNSKHQPDWMRTATEDQILKEQQIRGIRAVDTLINSQIFTGRSRGLEPTWGGYLESFNYDFENLIWKQQGNAMHILAFPSGHRNDVTFEYFDRCFLYSQEGDATLIAAKWGSNPKEIDASLTYVWNIWSAFDALPPASQLPSFAEFQINRLTISIQYWSARESRVDTRHFTFLGPSDFFEIKANIEGLAINLQQPLFEEIINRTCDDSEMDVFRHRDEFAELCVQAAKK